MNQTKPITRFGDEPECSVFFFRPLSRSWAFIGSAALLLVVLLVGARVIWKYWGALYDTGSWILLLWGYAAASYWWAIKLHAQVNELYLSGQISEQPAGSPQDQILGVAETSITEGLNRSLILTLFLILSLAALLGKSHT